MPAFSSLLEQAKLLSLTTLVDIIRDTESPARDRRIAAAIVLRYAAACEPRPSSPPRKKNNTDNINNKDPGDAAPDNPTDLTDRPPPKPLKPSVYTDPRKAYFAGYEDRCYHKYPDPPPSTFPKDLPRRFPIFPDRQPIAKTPTIPTRDKTLNCPQNTDTEEDNFTSAVVASGKIKPLIDIPGVLSYFPSPPRSPQSPLPDAHVRAVPEPPQSSPQRPELAHER